MCAEKKEKRKKKRKKSNPSKQKADTSCVTPPRPTTHEPPAPKTCTTNRFTAAVVCTMHALPARLHQVTGPRFHVYHSAKPWVVFGKTRQFCQFVDSSKITCQRRLMTLSSPLTSVVFSFSKTPRTSAATGITHWRYCLAILVFCLTSPALLWDGRFDLIRYWLLP